MKNKFLEDAEVLENRRYKGDYFVITFYTPEISKRTQPGQFVHLRLPDSPELLLRRPFSIYDINPASGTLSLMYKIVGAGTHKLSLIQPSKTVSLLGPLGQGFPLPQDDERIIIVAGGYGCASTYLLAKNANRPGLCLFGARTKFDILVEEKFKALSYEVRCSTNDGSYGQKGLVTKLLSDELDKNKNHCAIYACGPNAMLTAVGLMCLERDYDAYLSFDIGMCCGVGACFTCVIKKKTDNESGWEYIRICKYGPVFKASEIYWDQLNSEAVM